MIDGAVVGLINVQRLCFLGCRPECPDDVKHKREGWRDKRLVARFNQIEGYRCFNLTRAVGVVKCQLALA